MPRQCAFECEEYASHAAIPNESRPAKSSAGRWKEPELVPFVLRNDFGNRIEKIDLLALAREKKALARAEVPDVPVSFNRGPSLADCVRLLTPKSGRGSSHPHFCSAVLFPAQKRAVKTIL
jgi:hypothetical protein